MHNIDEAFNKSNSFSDFSLRYFKYMRSSKKSPCYFYCCNRLEKELPDGSIIKFINYPWKNNDDVLIDELCPWYKKYPSLKPPFFRKYDGPQYSIDL